MCVPLCFETPSVFIVLLEGSVVDPLFEALTLSHHPLSLRRVLFPLLTLLVRYKELPGLLNPMGSSF